MYVTSWRLQSVIKLNKFNSSSYESLMTNLSRPFTIHVYHRQEQPESKKIFLILNFNLDIIFIFKLFKKNNYFAIIIGQK